MTGRGASSLAVHRSRVYQKRDRLKQLRTFCYAVRHQSITQAAELLGGDRRAASLHIRELEYELEARLFERHGARMTPTEAGQCFYEYASPLVQAIESLDDDLVGGWSELSSTPVTVAVESPADNLLLGPVVAQLRRMYPEVRLRLRNASVSDGLRLLANREVDLVIGGQEPHSTPYRYQSLLSDTLVLMAPRGHPLARCKSVTIDKLRDHPAIVPSTHAYDHWLNEFDCRRLAAALNVVLRMDDWALVRYYVAAGLGIAVAPRLCLASGDTVASIRLEDFVARRSQGIYTLRSQPPCPAAQLLLSLIFATSLDGSRVQSARSPSRG